MVIVKLSTLKDVKDTGVISSLVSAETRQIDPEEWKYSTANSNKQYRQLHLYNKDVLSLQKQMIMASGI